MKDLLKIQKQIPKRKIRLQKLNSLKLKLSLKDKENSDWEKIPANYIPKKEQIFRKYKDLSQLNNKKTYYLISKKWARDSDRRLIKEI